MLPTPGSCSCHLSLPGGVGTDQLDLANLVVFRNFSALGTLEGKHALALTLTGCLAPGRSSSAFLSRQWDGRRVAPSTWLEIT